MSKWVMQEPILDIYVPRSFQWYKELLNPLSFDPCNCFLKIWKSTWTLIPKVEAPLGVWTFIPSHFPTFLRAWGVISRLPSWLATLQALALVTNPRLRLQQLGCVWLSSLSTLPCSSFYSWTPPQLPNNGFFNGKNLCHFNFKNSFFTFTPIFCQICHIPFEKQGHLIYNSWKWLPPCSTCKMLNFEGYILVTSDHHLV
jgi:hypothetical protein